MPQSSGSFADTADLVIALKGHGLGNLKELLDTRRRISCAKLESAAFLIGWVQHGHRASSTTASKPTSGELAGARRRGI